MPMLSLYDEGAFPLCPAPFNLAAYVLDAGRGTPDKDALVILRRDTEERWTFNDLISAVRGVATGLLSEGLAPGDRVLMRLGNTVDFPVAFLGALTAGLVPVPTSAALTEAETRVLIDLVKPRIILRDPSVACAPSERICETDRLRGWYRLAPAPFHMDDPDRVGYIIFTSGTMGAPRGVVHAHRAIWARRMMFEGWYGLTPSDRMMHAGAFNWTYTLGTGLMDPWTLGATAIIPEPGTSSPQLGALIERAQPTIFAAAPGVYRQMLDQGAQITCPSLRHGLSAGEKLPERTAARWQAITGTPVFEAFGMSECSTFISHAAARPAPSHTLGRPQTGRRIALLRDGQPVPLGDTGTIAVARTDPGLMLGYLDAPQDTKMRFQSDWFLTGDEAVMGEDGSLSYAGRADDMMNAGGFRVSPLEVERVLASVEGIESAAAAEVQIKADTTVIAAFYTGPHPLDEAQLRSYVDLNLARYKQPRVYIHVAQLPTGPNGKLRRRALPAIFERHHVPDD